MRAAIVILCLLYPLVFMSPVAANHASGVTWGRTYAAGYAYSVQQTRDGGFVVGGRGFGAWVMKTGTEGEPEWNRYYVPVGYTDAEDNSVQQTRDGGYIIAGSALRSGGWDAWLLKLDHEGDVQWSKVYRGAVLSQVEQTADGGYIAAGNFGTIGAHDSNGWVLKLNREGDMVWQEVFEGQDIHSVDQTREGGFVVAGTVGVNNNAYAWVFKLDLDGKLVWQKAFGVTTYNPAYSVQQIRDGGYIVIGEAIVLTPYGSFQSSESLFLRLDRDGNLLWLKSYGGGGFSRSFSVDETFDKGFIVAGASRPTISGHGVSGSWLLKLDSKGSIWWQKLYAVSLQDAHSTNDKGIVTAGSSVLKLDDDGSVPDCPFGAPSNQTLANISPSQTSPSITGVSPNHLGTPTSVNIATVPSSAQIQCIGS